MSATCRLSALQAYAPDTVLSNDDLTKLTDTSDEWIFSRTGIKERHKLADTQNASDLALIVARKTLHEAGLEVGALTHILAATCTQDMLSPSVACILAGALNAGPVMAFDISAACTGFLYGLSLTRSLLTENPDANILFVCVEALTRRINWTDRSTCVLFGDGAAACVCSGNAGKGSAVLEDVLCKSDGSLSGLISVGGGTACRYAKGDTVGDDFFLHMQGRETYRHAVRQMTNVCEELLARNGLAMAAVDLFVPHQANMRIIEAVGCRLNVAADRVFTNVEHYGNTSAASIPLALAQACSVGRIRPGGRVLVTAFGAGLTWGAALLRF
ncbi:beta-ketoacyl-ACP synthase III [Candidatus Desulfovibrio trichonymphae]|uniref:Beta-ketoacyl-[acyl-carrier-protein] synthase III n=1 Tax=Candidatus Desulfovibrio trichonymphae TaxID=1725232 RepID=A0A1J1DUG8_9BACT|nr:beta-ketoacyl-ACP synthase III [Candidatus Desulfovibrio trichonymphae]BAV92357.1 3-oxoacyl-[acyl-carrier-protein] synthase 3 [Candidatus Desulfovibrio trichonymphae]GHU90711.1 3-oxoacyl-[acyl-carrier-protein] synthase 3 [Deltaproteobacteria bacterium]GHU96730.1 3-oxoacyl-[acyl-carrier-protein] synthase 3 [Deltaproteobacteria bacterium]